jgi:hypothetical protein
MQNCIVVDFRMNYECTHNAKEKMGWLCIKDIQLLNMG